MSDCVGARCRHRWRSKNAKTAMSCNLLVDPQSTSPSLKMISSGALRHDCADTSALET